MMDKFNEFYMMQNQAKKFEQGGLDDKALELYLKIVEEYMPNNDFSFDRAATLLEKKFKYAEAIALSEKAIAKIKAGDLQGDVDKFQKKIDRMRQRAHSDADFQAAAVKKEPEEFNFGLPGFRSSKKLLMLLGSAYYALAAFSAYPDQLNTFLFLFAMAFVGSYGMETMMKLANSKACTKALAVTLVALIIAGYSAAQIPQVKVYWATEGSDLYTGEGEKEGAEAPEDSGATDTPDTDRTPPEIPDKYLEATAKAAEKHPATEHALVTAENGQVIIDLILNPGTSVDNRVKITEEMLRTLGGLMTSENLKGPDDQYFGELYDFYSATVSVTDTLEQPVAEASLPKKANTIKWTAP